MAQTAQDSFQLARSQLRDIGECELADRLVRALTERNSLAHTS